MVSLRDGTKDRYPPRAMNGHERMATALDLGQPDRVPVFDWIDERIVWGMAQLLNWDVTPPTKYDEATRHGEETDEVLDIYCRLIEELDIDGSWSAYSTGLQPERPDWGVDKYGRAFMLSEHGIPAIMGSKVRNLEEALEFDMASRLDIDDFKMLATMVERFGKDKYHVQAINGPFQEGWLVRGGMDHMFLDMAIRPEMAHRVGRITTDFNKAVVDIAHDLGADAMAFDGDLTGKDFMLMSMDHYLEYIRPYKVETVEYIHSKGMKAIKHSDGNMWALMDDIMDIGFDGFHPIQPQCMEMVDVKAYTEGKICLFGNVDCLDLLVFGTPEMVDEATRQTIIEGSPGGAHVLCSSNSLHPGVKPENALAMFRAAKKYGDYAQVPPAPAKRREDVNVAELAKVPTRTRHRTGRRAG